MARLQDFFAQAHWHPKPWCWALKFEIPAENWSTIWTHHTYSTQAEAKAAKREIDAQGWLREDGRLRVVKVEVTISEK